MPPSEKLLTIKELDRIVNLSDVLKVLPDEGLSAIIAYHVVDLLIRLAAAG